MSKQYYSKTEQDAAKREPFVRMGIAIALFGLGVAVFAGGIALIWSEIASGNGVNAVWAGVLTIFFLGVVGYFLKETVSPTTEPNPDVYLR